MPSPPISARLRAAAVRHPAGIEVAVALACVAVALWTQRRALTAFFSLDDLVIFEELHGLRPHALTLWRFLARDAYFRGMIALFGSDPFPYHLVSWHLHGANVAVMYLFVRSRGGGVLAAGLAAGLFGASRLHLSALDSVACIGDPLALGLTLGALLLADRGRRARAAAALLFLAALMCKESVAIMPVVLLLPGGAAGRFRERLQRAAPLIILGVTFILALVAMGIGGKQMRGEAYAWAIGANVFENLMTYTSWVVRVADPFPGFMSAIDPQAWTIGLPATAALGLLAVIARRAGPPPILGVAWWLLALLPVLPLLHHTYLYYLYVPLAGLAIACAGIVAWAARGTDRIAEAPRPAAGRRRSPGRPRVRSVAGGSGQAVAMRSAVRAAAILMVVAHAISADRLLAVRYDARMKGFDVPLDPELRKSEIARHAVAAVGTRLAGARGRVAFLLPAERREIYGVATGVRQDSTRGSRVYPMVAGALDDGRGLRALCSNVDSVAFLFGWAAGHGEFEMFAQGRDGKFSWFGRGPDGFAEWGSALMNDGSIAPARRILEGALSEFPDHAPLRFQLAGTHYLVGDSAAGRRELDELVRRSPDHPIAAALRASFPSPPVRGRP